MTARGAVRAVPPAASEPTRLEQAEATHAAETTTLDALERQRAQLEQQLAEAARTFKADPTSQSAVFQKLSLAQQLENLDEQLVAQKQQVHRALLELLSAQHEHHARLASREHGLEVGRPITGRQLALLRELVATCVQQQDLRMEASRHADAAQAVEAELRAARGEAAAPLAAHTSTSAGPFLSMRVAVEQLLAETRPRGDASAREASWIVNALRDAEPQRRF